MMRKSLILAAALSLMATAAHAQVVADASQEDVVDRVVAIVGDSVVLLTQVVEQIEQMRLQNPASVPTGSGPAMERFQRQVLEDLVDRLVILQAALKDTVIQVDEERVEEIVGQEIESRTRQYPSGQTGMAQALLRQGLTLAQYREILKSQVRQSQLQQMYVQRAVQGAAPLEVSETDLRAAFEEAQASLTQRPRIVTFEQVVLAPSPSEESKQAAREKAEAILDSLRAGAEFEEMARRYSQDPGSAENGGDLDWFRRGQMVREFEDAAFALMDGQVSGVVETEFGFHIIKVERSRAGERKGRHILIRPEVGSGDMERARALADSVAGLARSGTPMSELYDEFSDPLAPDTLTVAYDQIAQLPPGYDALRNASQGEVLGPVEYDTGRNEMRLAVIRVREIREAGAYTYDDVKTQLAERLQQTRQLEQLLERLRARTHIEILM